MEHRYHTLDVFTTTRFAGNPLAVFTDGDGLSEDEMLVIAREMNLSETVFVQKPTDEEALFKPAKLDKKKLASALGLSPKDFDTKLEPEFVSTGILNDR